MVMKEERFLQQCKDAYEYMASLVNCDDKGRLQAEELLSRLCQVVEELSLAGEELNQQAEELTATRDQLAAQQQHYRDLFDFAPDGYLITDKDGTIAEC